MNAEITQKNFKKKFFEAVEESVNHAQGKDMNPEEKVLELLKNKDWKLGYGFESRLDSGIVSDINIIEMRLTNTTFSRRIYICKVCGLIGTRYTIRFWEENKDSTIFRGDYGMLFYQLSELIERDRKITIDNWK